MSTFGLETASLVTVRRLWRLAKNVVACCTMAVANSTRSSARPLASWAFWSPLTAASVAFEVESLALT